MNKKIDKKIKFAKIAQVALLLLSAGAAYGMGEYSMEEYFMDPEVCQYFMDPAMSSSEGSQPSQGLIDPQLEQGVIIRKNEQYLAFQEVGLINYDAIQKRMSGRYCLTPPVWRANRGTKRKARGALLLFGCGGCQERFAKVDDLTEHQQTTSCLNGV